METTLHLFPSAIHRAIGLQMQRGRVVSISKDGQILVADHATSSRAVCEVLRTSAAPPPPLAQDDEVLYITGERSECGYILGLIPKYHSNGLAIQHLQLKADERIELRCGESSLSLSKEGKVVLRGVEVISRAKGVNKIKGAAVKIN